MIEALFGWPPPVLDPMGPYATPVRTVAWALFVGGALVTALVIAALFVAWKGPAKWRERLGGQKAVLWLGVAFPAVVLAGGGIRGGQVVGASDSKGAYPTDRPVTPADIHATVFKALGYDSQHIVYHTVDGRPTLLSEGQVIAELL